MFGVFKNKSQEEERLKEEIRDLKKKHQDQIDRMNSFFIEEKKTFREKNEEHWTRKMKSNVMNFEKVFTDIDTNLKTPQARQACIKAFAKIISKS